MRIRLTFISLLFVGLFSKSLWIPALVQRVPYSLTMFDWSPDFTIQGKPIHVLQDAAFDDAVSKAIDRLVQGSPGKLPPHRVVLVDYIDTMAAAAPDGTIYIGANALQFMQSSDEFAGVLAHELGHLIQRFNLQGRLWILGETYLEWCLAGVNDDTRQWLKYRLLAWRRHLEGQADEIAFHLMRQARLPTHGMIEYFARAPSKQPTADIYEIFSTHPADAHRIAHLKDLEAVAPLLPPLPLEIPWPEFKRIIEQTKKLNHV